MPHGQRYGRRCHPDFLAFARQIPNASFRKAIAAYEIVLAEGCTTDELAYLACNDRFFLLTQILRRPDAIHPWLYARCREVEANPDGYLDLWARYHYKAESLETPTPTPTGWRRFGDLEVGDRVFGPDGRPTTVVGRTPVFTDADCYRVTFDKGESIVCSGDHLWTVDIAHRARQPDGSRSKRATVTIDTRALAKKVAHAELIESAVWPSIPVSAPLEYDTPATPLPLSPYLLGAWLGDGARNTGVITNAATDNEIVEKIEALGYRTTRRGIVVGIYGIRPGLRAAGVFNSKHIPSNYARASVSDRWELLRGLMDTDGHCDTRGTATFVNSSDQLAADVFDLAAGLGLKPSKRRHVSAYKGEPYPFWHVSFQVRADGPAIFALSRKQSRATNGAATRSLRHAVVRVERVESVPVRCIQVERGDGLYLTGRHLIPTHNSTIGTFAGAIQEIARNPDIKIAIFSLTKEIAGKFGQQIMREVEENPLMAALFPDVFPENPVDQAPLWSRSSGVTVYRKQNPKEATISWYGILDALPTGSHFDLRNYDDIITERVTTMTDTDQIKRITTQWELSHNLGTLESNRMWHFGTRYTYADSYGLMISEGMLKVRLYPATHNGRIDGRPVLMTQEKWDEQKVLQKSQIAAQMLQNPLATNAATFTVAHLRPYLLRPRILNVYILGDPSKGTGKRSDRTALIVLGYDAKRNVYLLDGMLHRMRQSERWANLKALHQKWKKEPGVAHVRVGYERYGMQTDLEYFEERMIAEEVPMDLVEVSWTRDGTVSKGDRIGRLEPLFRNSRFWFPRKVWRPIDGNSIWKAQPNDPTEKDSAWAVHYTPLITADTKAAVSELYADPDIDPEDRERRLVNMTLLREEREAIEAGEGHLVIQPIKRMNEDRQPYDLTTELFLEFSMHPFSPHDDGLDATSRIFDVDPTPPLLPQAYRDLVPMALE